MGTQNEVSFIIISTLLTGKLRLREVRVHRWDSNPGLFGLQNLWVLHHAASQSQIEPAEPKVKPNGPEKMLWKAMLTRTGRINQTTTQFGDT